MSGLTRTTFGWVSPYVCCGNCGGDLPTQAHQGQPRRFCSERCRVAASRARRKAAA